MPWASNERTTTWAADMVSVFLAALRGALVMLGLLCAGRRACGRSGRKAEWGCPASGAGETEIRAK